MSDTDTIAAVAEIYKWLDETLANRFADCNGCGKCCNFKQYDHRLYITSVELEHFKHHLADDLRPMNDGICPYCVDNKCTAHPHRFAGCRIFNCQGTDESQAEISELAIAKLKEISTNCDIQYSYMELSNALNSL